MRRQCPHALLHVLRALAASLCLAACSGTPEPDDRLTLATRYVGVQVVRDMPDGLQTSRQFAFPIELTRVQVAGGGLTFTVASSSTTGTFDDRTGEFTVGVFTAAVTSTTVQTIEAMGGRGDDGVPADGVAQDLTGFVRSKLGGSSQESAFVARAAEDPPGFSLDPSGFTANEADLGRVRVTGPAGALLSGNGLEVLVYGPQSGAPTVALFVARPDGSIDDVVSGRVGDILVLSALRGGVKSLPVAITVN